MEVQIQQKPTVNVLSSENRVIPFPFHLALHCQTLKNLLEDTASISQTNPSEPIEIPLQDIKESTLLTIRQYLELYHVNSEDIEKNAEAEAQRSSKVSVRTWEQRFVTLPQQELFELVHASNFLDMKRMFDVACQGLANLIAGKTPDQIRETFGIENDVTPEEEKQMYQEFEWMEPRTGDKREREESSSSSDEKKKMKGGRFCLIDK